MPSLNTKQSLVYSGECKKRKQKLNKKLVYLNIWEESFFIYIYIPVLILKYILSIHVTC